MEPTQPPDGPIASPAERLIASLLSDGPLPFQDVMALALYGPGGYHTAGHPTGPPRHPAFGAAIAVELHREWLALDAPGIFQVVEPGAGGPWLARDILAYARAAFPDFAASLRYVRLAPNAIDAAAGQDPAVRVLSDEDALPDGFVGSVLAHGFFASLPVHWLFKGDNGWQEAVVRREDDQFLLDWNVPTADARGALADLPAEAPPGTQRALGLAGRAFLGAVVERMARGYVLVMDVGAADDSASTDPPVRGRVAGATVANPLEQLGRRAIEAPVDFGQLQRFARAIGLVVASASNEPAFLREHGLSYWEMFPGHATERTAFEGLLAAGARETLLLAKNAPTPPTGAPGWDALPRPSHG